MLFSKVLVIDCHNKIFPPEIAKAGHGQELRPKSEYRHPAQAGDGARPELLAELATRLQSLEIRQRAVTANYVIPDNPLRTRLQARQFINSLFILHYTSRLFLAELCQSFTDSTLTPHIKSKPNYFAQE